MSKVLVTSANGTVGREVVEALLRAGRPVRAAVHRVENARALQAMGAEVRAHDYHRPREAMGLFEGVSGVFLASPPSQEFASPLGELLSMARKAGVESVVRLSAFGADASAAAVSAAQHGKCEALVKDAGLRWTVLQPVFFMDNFLTYSGESIRTQGVFYGSSHGAKVAYVSARTIGEVAAAALVDPARHHGKTHVLTGPSAVTDAEVAIAIGKALGKAVRYQDLDGQALERGLVAAGVPPWLAQVIVALEGVKANGWVSQVSPAVREVLGHPGETIEEYMQRQRGRLG